MLESYEVNNVKRNLPSRKQLCQTRPRGRVYNKHWTSQFYSQTETMLVMRKIFILQKKNHPTAEVVGETTRSDFEVNKTKKQIHWQPLESPARVQHMGAVEGCRNSLVLLWGRTEVNCMLRCLQWQWQSVVEIHSEYQIMVWREHCEELWLRHEKRKHVSNNSLNNTVTFELFFGHIVLHQTYYRTANTSHIWSTNRSRYHPHVLKSFPIYSKSCHIDGKQNLKAPPNVG